MKDFLIKHHDGMGNYNRSIVQVLLKGVIHITYIHVFILLSLKKGVISYGFLRKA